MAASSSWFSRLPANPFAKAESNPIVAAAAAAAAPADSEGAMTTEPDDEAPASSPNRNGTIKSTRTLEPCAYGRCSSVESAYKDLAKFGMDPKILPTHVEAAQGLDPANLTVFATETALRNGVKAVVAVQRAKKRSPDGSPQLNVGWALLP